MVQKVVRLGWRFAAIATLLVAFGPSSLGGVGLFSDAPAADAYSSTCARAYGYSPFDWNVRYRAGNKYCVRTYYTKRCVTVTVLPGWTMTECRTYGPYFAWYRYRG